MRIVSAPSQTGPVAPRDEDLTAGAPLVPPELIGGDDGQPFARSSDGVALVERAVTYDALLGPPALITGEDPGQYDELLERVRADVTPTDSLEEIWVRDIVDLVWETRRWRRLKASLLQVAHHSVLAQTLIPLVDLSIDTRKLVRCWARQDPDAIEEVNSTLASAGLTLDNIMAETLAERLDSVERIERMIAASEARRNVALREIQRHRAVLAEKLRRVAQETEFEDVPSQAAHHGLAS